MDSRSNRKRPAGSSRRSGYGAIALGFLAAMVAAPGSATIPLPNEPLTTGARVPPNILFVLDDSGSMAFDAMPASSTGSNWTTRTYVHNTVYYNPATTYQPWLRANGTPMTGGTSYSAVYGDFNLASSSINTINLADSGSCRRYNRNNSATDSEHSSGTWVCGGVQTSYVPRNTASTDATYLANQANYYRYQILTDQTVERAEWGTATDSSISPTWSPATGLSSNNNWLYYTVDIPAGVVNLTVTTTGGSGSGRQADLYVRRGSQPTTNDYDCRSRANSSNNESCSTDNPAQGTWYIGIHPNSSFSGVTLRASYTTSNRCAGESGTTTWINCTAATPTGRSVAAELQNYATWFSYHRTRMKAAKAGASVAFASLGNDVRVGFRTIWERQGTTGGNWPTQANPIPVTSNNGLFSDETIAGALFDNRTKWYSRLHGAIGYNGTPLHGALDKAGRYFSSSNASGPYGPEAEGEQLACRQNFTILTTDGYWNDFSNYPTAVGNVDNTNASTINEASTGSTFTYTAGPPYADGHTGTLADVAMHYWNRDLRSNLRNIVPTSTANPAFWQHMVTFGISIGLSGNTGFRSVGDVPRNYASWPNPMNTEDADRIDDLLHAAVNSRGTFLSASNPDEFREGLQDALATIVERTGSFSNVAANSSTLNTDTQLFQANYVSGVWTGDVLSFPRNAAGTGFEATAEWKASEQIPTTNRRVFTRRGAFPGAITAAQRTALTRTGTNDYPVSGDNNGAYLAGNRSLELRNGGNLRNRNHLLGDIVNSSPAYVTDTKTIYVGANDGMLHAINTVNGQELFAFVPEGINWANLGTLSRPDYGHRYFVDGPVVVSSRKQTPGENILVGSLGRGGKGIFALDVTTPASFTNTNFKWESYETTGNNMGLVLGKPVIGRLNNGDVGLIVPNGINSTNGRAVLFVYNLRTGVLLREIDTEVGSPVLNSADSNGLMSPVGLDQDANGTLDVVYAGDMLGNVWKFDISSVLPAGWDVAFSGDPLFSATGPGGDRQPIMGGVTVGIHPTTYRPWVFFGTGRFMTTGDPANQDVQGLYGIVDMGAPVTDKAAELTSRRIIVATTADGQRIRGFQSHQDLPAGSKGWYIDLLEPPAPGTAIGERVVTTPQMSGSALVVSSIIPLSDACESDGRGYLNALDAFTGSSTSSPYFDTDGDGDFSDEYVEAVDEDGNTILVPIGSVDLGLGMVTQPTLFGGGGGGNGEACASGSTGEAGCIDINDLRNTGRVSWREVLGR